MAEAIRTEQQARGAEIPFEVVSNPEFLKEGSAVADFQKPDRIVIGSSSPSAIEVMKALHAPFNRNHDRIVVMDVRSAELTKYAANAMLATKISFMNELANLAERLGADIERVRNSLREKPSATALDPTPALVSSSSGPAAATAAPASPKTCRPWCAPPSRLATCPSCSRPWKR